MAERFGWSYTDDELEEIPARPEWPRRRRRARQFNNNRGADAPTSARGFRELLGQDPGPSPDVSTTPAPRGQGERLRRLIH